MWAKGQTGNPKGRRVEQISKDIWKKHGPAALETILHLSKHADEARVRLDAAKYIADQAYGKAQQKVEVTGKDGGPLVAVIKDA